MSSVLMCSASFRLLNFGDFPPRSFFHRFSVAVSSTYPSRFVKEDVLGYPAI